MRRVVCVLLAIVFVGSSLIVATPLTKALPVPVTAPRAGASRAPVSTVPFFPNINIMDHSTPYAWQVEPTMVVNQSGTVFVGWKETDGPEAAGIRVGSSYSTDQGLTWAPNILMNQSHPNQNCHNSDPWMALGPDDRVHYAYLEYDCGSYFDITNTTTGNDWGSVHSVVGNGGLVDKDAMWVAPDNRIYAIWDEGNVLAVTWSDDGGATWKKPFVNPQDSPSSNILGTVIETAANGTVYVIWWDFSRNNIYFDWSADRGATWHADKRVNDRDGSAAGSGWQLSIPAMNVDQRTGAMYVTWPDTRNRNLDVYMSSSTDGGITWSANTRINDDTGGAIQYMVDLAIDSTGELHAAWEDKRNGNWNIFYSNSTDGGQTWTPNLRVTTEDTPGSYNRPGDYFAIEAGPNDDIYVVWTDGRGTDFDIYYARNPGFPSATVTVTTAPSGLSVTVDNVTAKAPVTKTWSIGSGHTISVAPTIAIGSTARYNWTDWSDGGSISHVVVATADQTYTASYRKQYLAKVAPNPVGLTVLVDNVTITSSFQAWWDNGTSHWLEAPSPQFTAVDVRYVWASWSDNGSRAHAFLAMAPLNAVATFLQEQALQITTAPAGLTFTLDGSSYGSTQTFWLAPDSYHTVSVPTLQSGGTGTRYTFAQWSDGGAATHVIHFTGAAVLEATFHAEYYLTVTSPVPGASGTAWYAAGSYAIATVTSGSYASGPGERLSFSGWAGDATGTGLSSDPILMDGPKTAVAEYGTQFYLSVSSPYGTTAGTGWYDNGSSASAGVNGSLIGIAAGTRASFAGWSGDASGSSTLSTPLRMDGPKSAVATWQVQYLVRVQDDLGLATGGGWYATGTQITLQAPQDATSGGQRYAFGGWTGGVTSMDASVVVTVSGPLTVRATWTSTGAAGGLGADTVTLLSAIVIVIAVLLAVLFVWWRRKRKE